MGAEARARLGLAALGAVTLFSFTDVFAAGDYVGPAMLAVLVSTAVAMTCRRLGVSIPGTILLSAGLAFWYLSLIFAASHTFLGLPTPGSARALGDAISAAYQHSLVDYAPVPVRTGYVVMVVVAMWTLGTIGEVSTFRRHRPLFVALPCTALFALVLVVGTGEGAPVLVPLYLTGLLTYLGLESAYRVRSWGRWVPVLRDRRGHEPTSVTGRLARRMGATCVGMAVVAPLFLPALDAGVVSWRRDTGGTFGGGSTASGEIDPLVSVVPELITQSDTELFRVRASETTYWRIMTLSEFDGERWTPSGSPDASTTNGSIATDVPISPGNTRFVEQEFEITALQGEPLPAAVMPENVAFEGDDPEGLMERLRYDNQTGDLALEDGMEEGLTYSVNSYVPDVTYQRLTAAQVVRQAPEYHGLPEINPEIGALARRWTRAKDTPFEKLVEIQNRLLNFSYSLDVNRSASSDYLYQFLFETRAGYCQQFATAFAVLARSLDYPARVSVGFLSGATTPETPDNYVVRGTDAHAWPEVYFQDYGWIAFEPTPRAETAPFAYTIPGGLVSTNLRGPESDPNNVRAGRAADERAPRDRGRGAERDRRRGPGDDRPASWEERFGTLLRGLGVVALAFFVSIPALKMARVRRRYARAGHPADEAAAAFGEFEDHAAELASPRGRSESARSYARRIAAERGLSSDRAERLAAIYEAAAYSARPMTPPLAGEARRLVRELARALWQGASWWKRGVRLFSPGRLVGDL